MRRRHNGASQTVREVKAGRPLQLGGGDVTTVINTDRLVIRPWTEADAGDALAIYGHRAVAAWLPADIPPVTDECVMLSVIRGWLAEDQESPTPAGRWAVELQAEHRLIGGCS